MRIRRLLPVSAVVIGALGLLAACGVPGLPGTTVVPSIQVVYEHVPGGEVPEVHGVAHIHVNLHASGTVRMALEYYSPGQRKWEFAGADHLGNPWNPGENRLLLVIYPCLRDGLRWRLHFAWDGVVPGSPPDSGTKYWPSRYFPPKIACKFIPNPAPAG